MKLTVKNNQKGFTIVELLVVIVVIGILAAITIVSYAGISQRAGDVSLQSDLKNASTKLKLYYTEYGYFPTTMTLGGGVYCPSPADARYCVNTTSGNTLVYVAGNGANPQTFTLNASSSTNVYFITNNSAPSPWVVIGTQYWAPANLNVGTKILLAANPSNNSVVEKWCYNDLDANCTTYGGLYSWNEMMQYVTTEGVQGICPAGTHIPSDTEWKTLDKALGMDQATADLTGWRGTDQGTQVKAGGSSGLNFPMTGYRNLTPSWMSIDARELIWSSTENGAAAWLRNTDLANAQFRRDGGNDKNQGFSVRCLKN